MPHPRAAALINSSAKCGASGDTAPEGRHPDAVVTNVATGASIPVFVGDYVLMGYGTRAITGCSARTSRTWEFAKAFELTIVRTVQPPEGFEEVIGMVRLKQSAGVRVEADGGSGCCLASRSPGGP